MATSSFETINCFNKKNSKKFNKLFSKRAPKIIVRPVDDNVYASKEEALILRERILKSIK